MNLYTLGLLMGSFTTTSADLIFGPFDDKLPEPVYNDLNEEKSALENFHETLKYKLSHAVGEQLA